MSYYHSTHPLYQNRICHVEHFMNQALLDDAPQIHITRNQPENMKNAMEEHYRILRKWIDFKEKMNAFYARLMKEACDDTWLSYFHLQYRGDTFEVYFFGHLFLRIAPFCVQSPPEMCLSKKDVKAILKQRRIGLRCVIDVFYRPPFLTIKNDAGGKGFQIALKSFSSRANGEEEEEEETTMDDKKRSFSLKQFLFQPSE